ncbi:hypothetical protein DFP72DRAFT_1045862 [Ephemerocybe angulata]|uniref:Uncharacterized protein n=1 Tax=Ephemerocybe angulata TaxID=980116 RepID=A0A8H6HY78_9AGAR|nr:hypothetical protein DFP72DRAFT_1045862 [Tulosesus angulatus]
MSGRQGRSRIRHAFKSPRQPRSTGRRLRQTPQYTIRIERDGYQKIYEATEAEKRHIARRDAVNVWALRRTQRKLDNLREELKELKEKHQHLVAESLVNPSSPHGEPQSQKLRGSVGSQVKDVTPPTHQRIANPIVLNSTTPVQLGPKRSLSQVTGRGKGTDVVTYIYIILVGSSSDSYHSLVERDESDGRGGRGGLSYLIHSFTEYIPNSSHFVPPTNDWHHLQLWPCLVAAPAVRRVRHYAASFLSLSSKCTYELLLNITPPPKLITSLSITSIWCTVPLEHIFNTRISFAAPAEPREPLLNKAKVASGASRWWEEQNACIRNKLGVTID